MKTIISDTCDVFFKRLSDNKLVFTAEAQLASISQKIKEDKIKGGIGNRDIAVLRSEKEVTLQVRNAVFDSDWLEMVAGTSYSSETNTVFKTEKGLVAKTSASDTVVEITGTPKTGGIIKLIAGNGEQFDATVVAGTPTQLKFSATEGTVGAMYTAVYQNDATGLTLSIDASKFSEKYYVEYQTIEYDIDTNEVINDLYWIFNSVTPSSAFDFSYENGKAQSPQVDFTCTAPSGSNIIGKVMEVPRV